MGLLLGCLGASWGLWWASWGYVGRLGCHPGGNGSICQFVFPLLGRSGSPLGALLGRLGGLLGRLGAVLGRLGVVLGALGPSWSDLGGLQGCLGASGRRKSEKAKTIGKPGKSMILASWCPLGKALGALLGRLECVLGRSWASWTDRSAIRSTPDVF